MIRHVTSRSGISSTDELWLFLS